MDNRRCASDTERVYIVRKIVLEERAIDRIERDYD